MLPCYRVTMLPKRVEQLSPTQSLSPSLSLLSPWGEREGGEIRSCPPSVPRRGKTEGAVSPSLG